ncbi:DNA alkylation repair protein [Providencia rettgeri]|uniref:DNA alkylation repair protein n=1 Tax=Providencia rettgeri TaxID=587 RepID=UPI0023623083|nr:DNA alkylation repair protein [Providencia rettgeri]
MASVAEEQNEKAFKHLFNEKLLQQLAELISPEYPEFNANALYNLTLEFPQLEMKARVRAIRDVLIKELPADYPAALKIIVSVLKQNKLQGFAVWPLAEFIQSQGLAHHKISFDALKLLTTYFTSEWAIRPFIKQYPDETMVFLAKCASDENVHVRRFSSEGSRPRLPWGEQLQVFIQDPIATRPILEALKFDGELYVRKSVANHLNDISKDHPDYVTQLLAKWKQQANTPQEQQYITWIIKQALRTLIKQGDPNALALIGVEHEAKVSIEQFSATPNITLGEYLTLNLCIRSHSDKPQNLVIDYIIGFMKANGKTTPKVFKLRTMTLGAHEALTLEKKHAVKSITTRQYYAGKQQIQLQINGKIMAEQGWQLILP